MTVADLQSSGDAQILRDRARNASGVAIRSSAGIPPDLFHRRQNAQFVVRHDIMPRWVVPLDIIQHLFFVDVDQHPAFHIG